VCVQIGTGSVYFLQIQLENHYKEQMNTTVRSHILTVGYKEWSIYFKKC